MSTNLTLRLEEYQNLKSKMDDQVIDEIALPKLVEFAEQFKTDDPEAAKYLREVFKPYNLSDYSFIVLGCTHFTFFREMIQSMMPDHVEVIDGNGGTCNQLMKVCEKIKLRHQSGERAGIEIHLTGGRSREKEAFISSCLAFGGDIEVRFI